MVKYLLLVAVALAVVVAEPPPQRNYLPPQARNGPSSTYGAPSAFAPQRNGPAPVYGAPNAGRGQQDDQAEPANYQFQWEVKDPQSGNDYSHQESRQGDQAQGSYQVLLPDGRTLIVEYEANENGYQPKIRYEGEANTNNGGYPRGPQGPY